MGVRLNQENVAEYLKSQCRWPIAEQVKGVYDNVPVGPVRCYCRKGRNLFCGVTVWYKEQLYWVAVIVRDDGKISVRYLKPVERLEEWDWIN
jgi:hypothetical protein